MTVNDLFATKQLPAVKDCSIADEGNGFVVPGPDFLASLSPDEPIRYIAILQFVEGEKRGNHYHKRKLEHLVVLDGTLNVSLFSVENPSDTAEVEIAGGEMLTIQSGCHHSVIAQTKTATALELSPQKLDLSDQYRLDID